MSFLTPKAQLTPVVESPANVTPTNDIKRGLKRRQTLDFNDENCPSQAAKLAKHDSCRNLASSISTLYSSPAKCDFTADSYKSPRKLLACSPLKSNINSPRHISSPLKLFSPLRELQAPLECTQSPTANLPNLIVDGASPRTVRINVKAKDARGTNWLTSYAKEKKQVVGLVQTQMKEAIGGLAKQTGGFSKVKQRKEVKKSVKKIVKLK